MPVKKNISVKNPGININIKNENNQQSKNKYVKPPPELNKNVPTAYQQYNPINTPLWNDPQMAEKMERKGYQRAIRPQPQPVGDGVRLGGIRPQPVGDGVRLGGGLNHYNIENRLLDEIDREIAIDERVIPFINGDDREPERRVLPFMDDMDDENWDGRATTISPPASAWDKGDRILGRINQNKKVQDLEKSFNENEDDEDEVLDPDYIPDEVDDGAAAGAAASPAVQKKGPGRPDILATERELVRMQLQKNYPTKDEFRKMADNYRLQYRLDKGINYENTKRGKQLNRNWLLETYL